MPSLNCPAPATLESYARGDSAPSERHELESHLESCPSCRALVHTMSLGPAPAVTAGSTAVLGDASVPGADAGGAGALQRGDKVGRHIIIGRIGAGGMGTVYAAYDTTLERKIALKFLSRAAGNRAASDRLVAEAGAMARLTHPNVVTVHDVGVHEGQPYLAMEYVQGQTLGQWRRERARPVREVLEVMAGVAQGLDAAHAAGLVHRDVKPANVLVQGRRVLVTDFGLSVPEDAGRGSREGTPAYMAPEQFQGQPATRATDVFGFSVTLYELLHGQHPFGDPADISEIRQRVLAGQVRPPPPGSRVPRRVQRLVLAGLAVDPAARPTSLAQVAASLLATPGRRARWAVLGLGAVGVALGAFWVGGQLEANPQRRCQAAGAVIDASWNAERRQRLAEKLRADTSGNLGRLAGRLDQYLRSWRAAHADTCAAAFGDRRISGELFDLRMSCLDRHRAGLSALVDQLPGASGAQLSKVASTPLPPPAECQVNVATKPLPPDQASRARVTRVGELMAQAEAALTLGDLARARRQSTEAVAEARALGYEPLLARALLQLAAIELRAPRQAQGGDASGGPPDQAAPDRALALLEQAIRAAELGRDDAIRAEAVNALVMAHREAGRLNEADRWAETAAAVVGRIGDPPLMRAALDLARGWILYDRRQLEEADKFFERSQAVRRQMLGPRAPEVLASSIPRCHAMIDAKPRVLCYQQVMALAREIGGDRHPDLPRLQANLAYAMLRDARTRPEACQVAAKAVEAGKAMHESNYGGLIYSMQILAMCLRDEGKVEEARRAYQQAIAWATHPTGPRGDVLQDYAVFLMMQEDWPGAIRYLKASIADRELVFGPTNTRPIETRYRLADSYRNLGQFDKALAELDAAIATCERAGATPLAYPDLYQMKGYTLMGMGRHEDGYRALLHALELHRQMKTPPFNHYDTLISLGEVERRMGKLDDAVKHLEQSMTLRTLEEAPVYHAVPALRLAETYWQMGRPHWPKGCEAARRALAGFSAPFGGSTESDRAMTRKWLGKLRCPPEPAG